MEDSFKPDASTDSFKPDETSFLQDIGDTLKQYGAKINPVTMAQGIADTLRHPIVAIKDYSDKQQKLLDSAKEAFSRGDHAEGVRHAFSYLVNGIPGLGAALDEAGNKAGTGDYRGAIADTAALATQIAAGVKGPAVVDALTRPGLGGDIAATAGGAVKGAAKAATDTTDLTRLGIKLKIPTVAANAGAGATVARAVGLPHEVGAIVGAGVPIVRGSIAGAREALAARAAARIHADVPEVIAPAAEPVVIPPSRQLPASNVIQMPAASDTSGPIPTNPQTGYPLRAGEAIPESAPAVVAPPPLDPKLLDDLARGLGGKSFEKLGPAGQETVRMLAARMKAQPAAVSPARPQPVAADNASIPQSSAVQPQGNPPVVPSSDAGSPSLVESRETLQPQATTIPFSKESPPAEVFKAAARADRGPKVELIARHMADTGIDPEMVDKIQPGQWRDIADALKIDLPKSLTATIRDVKARLADLKTSRSTTFQPSPEMMEQLKKPGAMEAARKLAEAMQN